MTLELVLSVRHLRYVCQPFKLLTQPCASTRLQSFEFSLIPTPHQCNALNMIALSKQINMTTYPWIANQKAILSPGANPHPLTFTFVELQNEYQMWRQHLVSVTNGLFFSESHMGAPSIVISCDRNPQNTCF